MTENAMGKLLPNIKVTLGSDTDSDNKVEEGEITDSTDTENAFSKNGGGKNVDVVRTWTLKNPKVYENKTGAFITGVDLSSEVLIKKLQERAERFGLEKKEKKEQPITQKEIDALYKSLDIDPENLNSCKLKNIRLESLHMRGVDEMDRKDIFAYFGNYGPASLEWINDFSCNVNWLDAASTARAMIGMSRAFVVRKKGTTQESTELLSKDEESIIEPEEVIEMSDGEEIDSNDQKVDEMADNSMECDSLPDTDKPCSSGTKIDSSNIPAEVVDIPVPPGHWRLGVPHAKAKAILLRFATKDDKKLPGAEKRSQYYQKYGNPNYGGMKGFISKSRKRKMQASRNRQVVESYSKDSTSQLETNYGKASRTKLLRMRMYADDEEDRKRNISLRNNQSHQSVHSRLGVKYTKSELLELGNKFSSDSEEDDDNVSINCTVPSRLEIWTDIAQSMSKEDHYQPRSNSPDSQSFVFRKHQTRARQDRFYTHESSPESSPESTPGSRPWRPSRDESSEDLRSSLNSQRGQSPLNRPREDLRSKIKRIKKEDSVNKHRSPMFIYD